MTSEDFTKKGAWAAGELLALSRIICAPERDEEGNGWEPGCDLDTACRLIASAQGSFLDFQEIAGDMVMELEFHTRDTQTTDRLRDEVTRLGGELRIAREAAERAHMHILDLRDEGSAARALALDYINAYDNLLELASGHLPPSLLAAHAGHAPSAASEQTGRRLRRGGLSLLPRAREEGPDTAGTTQHPAETPTVPPVEEGA